MWIIQGGDFFSSEDPSYLGIFYVASNTPNLYTKDVQLLKDFDSQYKKKK
jgi:hypothetical protein